MEYAVLYCLMVARAAVCRYWPIAVGVAVIFVLGVAAGALIF